MLSSPTSPRLLLYSHSLEPEAATGRGVRAKLDAAARLGVAGVAFTSVFELSPGLDVSELQDVRDCADRHDLQLEVGVGQLHPLHLDARADLLAAGDGDAYRGLERALQAARAIDCTRLLFTIGTIDDRFNPAVSWSQQLDQTMQLLKRLQPLLRDLGCRLLLKTHEEITSFEILRLIEAVGSDVLGVCFDPVNVLVRLEDPVAACRRLASFVGQVHVDDARLRLTDQGFERWLYPCGQGCLAWPTLVGLLPPELPRHGLVVELHRGRFAMPAFEPAWLAAQPDLRLEELAEVVRLSVLDRELPVSEAFQLNPTSRLAPTLAYWRGAAARGSGC